MPDSVFAGKQIFLGVPAVIGIHNGVMPVEQMQVTITKPIEDAINSVPGWRPYAPPQAAVQPEIVFS